MLAAANRLTSAEEFRTAVRRGRRAGGRLVVAHLHAPNVDKDIKSPIKVGFVVAKTVGPAVTRNRVKRRLRHLVRERLAVLPGGSMLVVRALPSAGSAGYRELGADLDHCLGRL